MNRLLLHTLYINLTIIIYIILFRIALLLLIIFCSEASSNYVWVVVDLMRIFIICFLHCSFFGSIWTFVSYWLGYFTVTLARISDHLLQFGHLGGSSKHHRSTMHLLWLSCIWVISNERNGRVFKYNWNTLCINCSTKLTFRHFGGWKRNTLYIY